MAEQTEAVKIKKKHYDALRESANKTGVSVSFHANRAIQAYIESGELKAVENALGPVQKKLSR